MTLNTINRILLNLVKDLDLFFERLLGLPSTYLPIACEAEFFNISFI